MATFLQRALRPSLLPIEASDYICQTCRRHQSSYRRTSKMLRVRPDPAFRPSKSETQDHIIFNPPSSAPNVYHTPSKFLPASDPRTRANGLGSATPTFSSSTSPRTTSAFASSSIPSPPTAISALPPSVRPVYQKKYHLKQDQVDEMRRLRKENPKKWTRLALAAKFECSQFFVSLCCEASKEIREENERKLAAIKARWGRLKTEAREARQERKKLWGRDA